MKVRAKSDIYVDGILIFKENEIYIVKNELPDSYMFYSLFCQFRHFSKELFTVVEEDVLFMKVKAKADILEDGKFIFLKDEVYTVKAELPNTYMIYTSSGELRCFPKKYFTVLEGGVK